MKKIIKRLVYEYDYALSMKKRYKYSYRRSDAIINYLLVFIVMIGIFTGIGFLINIYMNLDYVVYSLNTAFLGSFVLVKIYLEKKFMRNKGINYKVLASISVEVLFWIAVVTMVSAIQLLFSFYMISSNIVGLMLLLISTISITCLLLIARYSENTNNTIIVRIFFVSVILNMFSMAIYSLSLISNPVFAFSLMYVFVLGVMFIKLMLIPKQSLLGFTKLRIWMLFGIIISILYVNRITNITNFKFWEIGRAHV